MRSWWALLGLRAHLALCNLQHFNVYDDPYAFPQYSIQWKLGNPVSEEDAEYHLNPESPGSMSPIIEDYTDSVLEEEDSFPLPIASYENIVNGDQRYICSIPYVAPQNISTGPTNHTQEDEKKELALATQRGWDLLKGMDGNCIYYISGWWSYSFCYNQGVRQFHPMPSGRNVPPYPPVEDKSVGSYVLGRFEDLRNVEEDPVEEEVDDIDALKKKNVAKRKEKPKEQTKSLGKLEVKGQTRYLVQHLAGGTLCDLTGEERRIEIQFHCDATSTDRISLIKETSICQYRMVISTPRLCNDVAFHPPKAAKPNPIKCHPVLNIEHIPGYMESFKAEESIRKTAAHELAGEIAQEVLEDLKAIIGVGSSKKTDKKAKKNKEDESKEKGKKLPKKIVGGIQFGGHKLVAEGVKIPIGAVISGGVRDKFLATIAKSNGFVMSSEDLAKHGIKNRKSVEDIAYRVGQEADGAEWTIDLYDTAHGPELRSIISDPGEKKPAKKSAKKSSEDGENEGIETDPNVEDEDGEWEEGSEEIYKEEL